MLVVEGVGGGAVGAGSKGRSVSYMSYLLLVLVKLALQDQLGISTL